MINRVKGATIDIGGGGSVLQDHTYKGTWALAQVSFEDGNVEDGHVYDIWLKCEDGKLHVDTVLRPGQSVVIKVTDNNGVVQNLDSDFVACDAIVTSYAGQFAVHAHLSK